MSEATVTRLPGRPVPVETAAKRAARLNAEAKDAARLAVNGALQLLSDAACECAALTGLEPIPPGARDVLRQIGEQIEAAIQTATAIMNRS